jgi:hypothetical protein
MDLRNKLVHFRIRDVFIPEAEKLLMKLHGNDLLQGTVIDVASDSREGGAARGQYAVICVPGVEEQLIVPVAQILGDAWTPFK